MPDQDDDLGDASSRDAIRNHRGMMERTKGANPVYAYAPRWVPTGNWNMSLGDTLVIAFGVGIIALILGMKLFGAF
jgi:hypothetical protein